jgi:hypothetical protein
VPQLFIDFKKAYDSVRREVLYNILIEFGISLKSVSLIKMCLTETGKYELRPAFKKLYQLRPQVSASRVSVGSRFANSKHDDLRPGVSKELRQLRRKM